RLVNGPCASETLISRVLPEISAIEVPVLVSCIASMTGTPDSCQQTTLTRTVMPPPPLMMMIAPAGALCFGREDPSQISPTMALWSPSLSLSPRMAPTPAHRAEDHHHHHHHHRAPVSMLVLFIFPSFFPFWAATHGQTSAWSVSTALSSLHICWVIKRSGPSRYYCPPSDVGGPKRTVDKDGRLSEDGDED
ncbi:hypothetical protein TYRP_017393, partial [Tyrophagus putrescentiae]